ncbi:vancomycin resistance protein [Putridiphycobacter roseus]|uniref:Vancomycin resistance protein n=1 Tax=Putridiphycobacter roseus TaxID=2219161 RepID=A0A2W1NGW3_9FLAO|nr:VanW family protein [Putridiphycobacter roseus]PZE18333.1 vancomycin resistance protein [Putridiphycobacter roseus]
MKIPPQVLKPIKRHPLRRALGKEFFCLKRKWHWYSDKTKYAKEIRHVKYPIEITQHQSFLLKPLQNVDMQLQRNKTTNLAIAIKKFNGIVIKPGETFSFWKLVGRPSKLKGYLPGLVLSDGQIKSGIGGGLCQLGNLLFWMSMHTPLTIKQRYRHSYDVFPDVNRKVPFGSGATLAYNYIDLQIYNGSDQAFQLNVWLEKRFLRGSISTEIALKHTYHVFEKEHKFELQWWGGYTRHNEIWRNVIHKVSAETTEELVTENHAIMMYNPLLN